MNKFKKLIGKAYVAGVGAVTAFIPTIASAASPADYVNKATTSIFDQIKSISFNLALVALAVVVIQYMTAGGDDHKKAKIKWIGGSIVISLLIIAVLPDLVNWAKGLV